MLVCVSNDILKPMFYRTSIDFGSEFVKKDISFSVMSGWVFLSLISAKRKMKCPAQGHNTIESTINRSRV